MEARINVNTLSQQTLSVLALHGCYSVHKGLTYSVMAFIRRLYHMLKLSMKYDGDNCFNYYYLFLENYLKRSIYSVYHWHLRVCRPAFFGLWLHSSAVSVLQLLCHLKQIITELRAHLVHFTVWEEVYSGWGFLNSSQVAYCCST